MENSSKWVRVSARLPCPICKRKRYCVVSGDGCVVRCTRVKSDKESFDKNGGMAWLHRVGSSVILDLVQKQPEVKKLPRCEVESLVERFLKSPGRDAFIAALASELGVSILSLDALSVGLGYSERGFVFTSWPCYGDGAKVVGIVCRYGSGKKLCVKGTSNSGLFMPAINDKDYWRRPSVLMIVEGGSDVASAFSHGVHSVGKPSNLGGNLLLAKWIERTQPRRVIVVGENDYRQPCSVQCKGPHCLACYPGLYGAKATVDYLRKSGIKSSLIMPPDGIKDVRQWSKSANLCEVADCEPVYPSRFGIRQVADEFT